MVDANSPTETTEDQVRVVAVITREAWGGQMTCEPLGYVCDRSKIDEAVQTLQKDIAAAAANQPTLLGHWVRITPYEKNGSFKERAAFYQIQRISTLVH